MTTILSVLALLLALTALGYAWKLQQELGQATRRLDRYNKALYDASDELRRLRDEAASNMAQLRVEIMRHSDGLSFSPAMTVREAQLVHPQVQQVLAGFHLGGCSSCAVEPDDTLAKVCSDNSLDINTLLGNLNTLVQRDANGGSFQPVKLPNVTLEI